VDSDDLRRIVDSHDLALQRQLRERNIRCMNQLDLSRWLVLSISLPSRRASTARVRLWRAL